MKKRTYEELEAAFQAYCKHDGGRAWIGGSHNICPICGWDVDKCQHRGEHGKFCSQCGESLTSKGGAA